MPIKTSSGKWKWGNVERSSKKELVQTVYGIWKKNGSKGSFSDFLKGTHESIVVNEYAGNKYFVKVDPRIQKHGQDSGYETIKSPDGKILGFKNSRGDCVIRALALATGLSYLNVAKKLHIELDEKGDVPKDYGGTKWETVFEFFHKTAPSVALLGMKQNITIKEFARTISRHAKFKNTYFIVGCEDPTFTYGHAVFVKNGKYYDSWDCGDWIVVDVFDATRERGLNAQDYRNIVQIRRGTKKRYKKESYEPPYTLDMIKQKYGDEVYRKLRDDPVHKWRAETGIELIHHEPTKEEFERIVKNWDLMSDEDKKKSDEKSVEIFGRDNKDRIELLRKEYDFKVGDRVNIRKGLRCRQSGHSGKIIRINLPEDHDYDSHGFSSFTIEMDDPNLGITSFQSGEIEKEMMNEAHEIHSYPEKLRATVDRITKEEPNFDLDHAYFNKEGKFIWMMNSKGYIHVFKPVKFVKTPGMTKPFGFKDLILKDNGMLEEVDRLRFADGNEGLKFLKDKYHLELKTIS